MALLRRSSSALYSSILGGTSLSRKLSMYSCASWASSQAYWEYMWARELGATMERARRSDMLFFTLRVVSSTSLKSGSATPMLNNVRGCRMSRDMVSLSIELKLRSPTTILSVSCEKVCWISWELGCSTILSPSSTSSTWKRGVFASRWKASSLCRLTSFPWYCSTRICSAVRSSFSFSSSAGVSSSTYVTASSSLTTLSPSMGLV
mmetsp:Transcript_4705/g.10544  ORF Transcript_4705/g.10544 Transcript_4705/m.10544 type:complete len:206 (-) Transcript_4705:927-1544(-)